jgi:hypothetical protein
MKKSNDFFNRKTCNVDYIGKTEIQVKRASEKETNSTQISLLRTHRKESNSRNGLRKHPSN